LAAALGLPAAAIASGSPVHVPTAVSRPDPAVVASGQSGQVGYLEATRGGRRSLPHLRGLTPAQNRALDLQKVRVVALNGALMVTVQTSGDFGALAGRGALRSAAEQVVFAPSGGGASLSVRVAGTQRAPVVSAHGLPPGRRALVASSGAGTAFLFAGVDARRGGRLTVRTVVGASGPSGSTRAHAAAETTVERYSLQLPPVHAETCPEIEATIRALLVLEQEVETTRMRLLDAAKIYQAQIPPLERELAAEMRILALLPAGETASRARLDTAIKAHTNFIQTLRHAVESRQQANRDLFDYGIDVVRALRVSLGELLAAKTAAGKCGPVTTPKPPGPSGPPAPTGPTGPAGPGPLGASFGWSLVDPTEVIGRGSFVAPAAGPPGGPLGAVRVIVPGPGGTPRQITNTLCPSQLPTATVSSTTNPNDTLTCSGGSLPVGQPFSLNVQTNPVPTPGLGGQLFGQRDGTWQGPFTIIGP